MNKLKEGSGFHSDYLKKLNYIIDYLDRTDNEILEKPAIIDPKVGVWGFKGKFGNEAEKGFRLVLLTANKMYFDTSLPRMLHNSSRFFGNIIRRILWHCG